MIRRLACSLALLAALPAAAQGFLPDGFVTEAGTRPVVRLDRPAPVARGTLVYTFETVDVNGQAVGRLTGRFRVFRADGLDLVVIPLDPAAPPTDLRAGQPVQVELSSRPGQVEVRSAPDGARVSWDGDVIGHTPLTLELAAGDYTFEFQVPGYAPASYTFTAEADVIIGIGVSFHPPGSVEDAP